MHRGFRQQAEVVACNGAATYKRANRTPPQGLGGPQSARNFRHLAGAALSFFVIIDPDYGCHTQRLVI